MDNDTEIQCYSLIWTAGVTQNKLIADLECEHDKGRRIVANEYLEEKDKKVFMHSEIVHLFQILIQENLIHQQHNML